MLACPACRYPVPYTPIQCPTCGKGLGHNEAVWLGPGNPAAARSRGRPGSLILALLFGGIGLLFVVALISRLGSGEPVSVFSIGIIVMLFVASGNRFMTWSRSSR